MAIELTVAVPTRDRAKLLIRCAESIARGASDGTVELIVVDDGSSDDTLVRAREWSAAAPLPVKVLSQPPRGPAAARNLAIAEASGQACLFAGDDVTFEAGSIQRHLRFHREQPEREHALLGRVVPGSDCDTELTRWLHSDGTQFVYGRLHPARPVASWNFWTANVSAKTELLREVGGFDEAFTDAAGEDAELGARLGRAGMRLAYDPESAAEHHHPTDLRSALARMRRVGRSMRLLAERAPEIPQPRPPGPRHRAKAAGLGVAYAATPGVPTVRHAVWRFLCDEVAREERHGVSNDPEWEPRIGGRLARRAVRDA